MKAVVDPCILAKANATREIDCGEYKESRIEEKLDNKVLPLLYGPLLEGIVHQN